MLPFSFWSNPAPSGPAPTVASVVASGASAGDSAGGYPFTITGANFTGATGATVGGAAVTSFVVVNATTITGVMPAGTIGTSSTLVTTPAGTNGANTLWKYVNPSALALTQWNRIAFAGPPWAANASAGSSGTSNRTLVTGGSDPTVGSALSGRNTIAFAKASSQFLATQVANNVLFGSTLTFAALVNVSGLDAKDATVYNNGTLASDGANGETTFGITASGVTCTVYSGGFVTTADIALSAGWHFIQFRLDTSDLQARVDGGSWTTIACGAPSYLTPGVMQVGRGYSGAHYLNGAGAEFLWADSALSNANLDDVRAYLRTRYQITV